MSSLLFDPCPLPSPIEQNRWYSFCQAVLHGVLKVGWRLTSVGTEHVPMQGGVLLAANHVSHLDPVVVGVPLPRQARFLAKEELFEPLLLGLHLRNINSTPIARGSSDRAALKQCVDVLKAGHPMVIFPEGTRSPDGTLQPGQPGAAMIAMQAGVPIVPVHLKGTFEAFPTGAKKIKRSTIRVAYGPAFDPNEIVSHIPASERKARLQHVTNEIMRRIGELSEL